MAVDILKQIAGHFKTNPAGVAFHINERDYTYTYLANKIHSIQQVISDIKSENIGVITADTVEVYALQLAIWFSGKTFIPLNPKNPVSRNQKIIEEGGIHMIFHLDYPEIAQYVNSDLQILNLADVKTVDGLPVIKERSDSTIAYILFTSGSTGIPKGVQISWGNFNAFMESYFDVGFKVTSNDRFLQMFDFSFDGSIMSYMPALFIGASVYTVPTGDIKFMEVMRILEEKEITIGLIVPSVITFLKPYFDEIRLEKFRYCIVGAEASYNSIMEKWKQCIPNGEIINFYGPTESTVFCLYYKFDMKSGNNKGYQDAMCLGRHVRNMEVYIYDHDAGALAPANVKGEIIISGAQLTKGYLNNPEKNKEAFFELVINNVSKRFYHTGDKGYYDEDGDFYYCGRIDNQIQVQGFRVELSEIEVPVRKHFNLDNVVAVERKDKNQNSEIFLFVENYGGNIADIMTTLKQAIPSYMWPSRIIDVKNIPLNATGKIDRKELLKLIP